MVFSLGDDDMGFRVWRIPEGSFQSREQAVVSPEAVSAWFCALSVHTLTPRSTLGSSGPAGTMAWALDALSGPT